MTDWAILKYSIIFIVLAHYPAALWRTILAHLNVGRVQLYVSVVTLLSLLFTCIISKRH